MPVEIATGQGPLDPPTTSGQVPQPLCKCVHKICSPGHSSKTVGLPADLRCFSPPRESVGGPRGSGERPADHASARGRCHDGHSPDRTDFNDL